MENKYRISFVTCLNEYREPLDDCNNLISLALESEYVQLVVVYDDTSSIVKNKLFDGKTNENISFVYASGNNKLSDELSKVIQGDYASFSRLEVSISEKDVKKLADYGDKQNKDIVIARISMDEKLNRIVREHDNYCDRYESDTDLNKNAYMLHNISFGYFFKTGELRIPADITLSNWAYDVIRLTYGNSIRLKKLGYAKGVDVHFTKGDLAINSWFYSFADEESVKNVFDNLIYKLNEERCGKDVIYKVNADYALLYYVTRLATGGVVYSDTVFQRKVNTFIDEFFRGISTKNIIIANKYISRPSKHHLLLKYFNISESDGSEELDAMFEPAHYKSSMIYFLEEQGVLQLEYAVEQPVEKSYEVVLKVDKEVRQPDMVMDFDETLWLNEQVAYRKLYRFDVAIADIEKQVSICIKSDKGLEKLVETAYGRYTPFTTKVNLYKKIGDNLIFDTDERSTLRVVEYSKRNEDALINRRNKSFIKIGAPGIKAIAARKMYEKRKAKQDKEVWLFSDRTNRGDDNGEALFEYVCKNPIEGVEPYFVVDSDTEDFGRMAKLGKVVAPFSREHKMLFLLSEYSLSSQANAAVINPFGKYEFLYRDIMYDKRLVFLQHGITKDNQSKWLNKYNRNLYGFIVTTKPEYDSVFEYDYYYKPERVWLTGMPRYDKLYHDERRYITVMPTWRKSLSAGTDEKGVWILGDEFKNSEYFKFYNDMLNNERLLKAAEEYGYKLCFMPHPNTIAGIDMFGHDPRVTFMDMSFSYRDVFAQTDLMVTDYSSVAFDFAYLRKPIVYSQFDKESFFSGEHSYTEGYFDYERDGFGEVEYTLDDVVDRVIEYMKDGCKLKPLYEERINNTFAFNDKDCCKRVIEYIFKLDKGL